MKRKILIVDDDPSICRFIARVCEDAGYEPLTATGYAGFERHVRNHDLFLVITDLQMPDCDGIECMRLMATAGVAAPVAILSGFDPRVMQTAGAFGRSVGLSIIGTLQKPVVVSAIRQLLEQAARQLFAAPEEALRAAIDSQQFTLFYQPKVSFRPEDFGTVVGFEGLARWLHPDDGIVMPDRFIELAESSRQIVSLTDRLLDCGLEQMRQWAANGDHWSLSINISPLMLDDRSFADTIWQKVHDAGVEPSRLTLEITESGAMADPTKTMETLTRLRLKGFDLSIDDFGTGYSSLVQLYRLPFSELKIDKSFVMDLDEREDAQVIVRTLIDLAHNLSLRVCAEGVETMCEWWRLIDYGCDRIQGYFVGKPMAAADIAAWFDEWRGRLEEITMTHTQKVLAWRN